MLIRNFDYMEKAMSISYDDIRQQRAKLDLQYEKRRKLLQDYGYKLTTQFRDSLSLPSQTWADSVGNERPYISIGNVNDAGRFQKGSLAATNLNDDHALTFKISTVLDDSPLSGGQHYLISIAMWYENGTLFVDVGNGKKKIAVSSPDEDLAFSEVCAVMKQLIMDSLTDLRLS